MSAEHICGLLAAILIAYVGWLGLRHHYRGEKCYRCGRRGHVTHEGRVSRCGACGSQWADGGHGWGNRPVTSAE